MQPVYLDNNATTVLKPEVIEAMSQALNMFGNPSSTHHYGRVARQAMDEARRAVADLVGVRSEQVVFTAGGTEANNMAIYGAFMASEARKIVLTATEHSSVLKQVASLVASQGAEADFLKLNELGLVDLQALENTLKEGDIAVVTVMYANNETGIIQPIADIAALCKKYAVPFHTDAVQVVGKQAVNFAELGCNTLSLSCHKFAGPKGVGALIVDGKTALEPLVIGGGQERGRRGGTENTLGIVGAGEAIKQAQAMQKDMPRVQALRDKTEQALKNVSNEIIIVGENSPRMPHCLSVITPGLEGELAVMSMDMKGICVSHGSACSSGKIEPSHVLKALGYSDDLAKCGLRIAFSWQNTDEDADKFIEAFSEIYKRIKG